MHNQPSKVCMLSRYDHEQSLNYCEIKILREAANLRRELAALDDRIAQVLERLGNP